MSGAIDQAYLRWFFNTTIEVTRSKPTPPRGVYDLRIERLYQDTVTLPVDAQFDSLDSALFEVSAQRVEVLAERLRALEYMPPPYGFLPAFQGDDDRARHLVNFLFFMVGIDHETHRGAIRYEDTLDGVFRHGSDLLYALAERAKTEDHGLFLSNRFASVTKAKVAQIFTTQSGLTPADIAGRTRLLRDCASGLRDRFNDDAQELLWRAGNRIGGPGGLLDLLRGFEAYSDPLGKKSNLPCKILLREGCFTAGDPQAMNVAIDHVVMTMALRSGVVRCVDPVLRTVVMGGSILASHQMGALREVTADAMRLVGRQAGVEVDRVDDLLWSYGRKALRRGTPLDDPVSVHGELDANL